MKLLRDWIEFLSRKKPAEDSVVFRTSVALTVMVGILACLHMLEWPAYGWAVMLLTAGGFVLSYHRRNHSNWPLKVLLSLLMLAALGNFFLGLVRSAHDPRLPLAELLLWLQTLHSFDLPARKDLNYSMFVALILISLGAVLSHTVQFGLYLAAYLLAALMSMHYNYISQIEEEAGREARSGLGAPAGVGTLLSLAGRTALGMLAVGVLVYAGMPRSEGMRLRSLPVSWEMQFQLPRVSKGQVVNPSYPSQASSKDRQRMGFSPDNYAGFNHLVDLNLRGTFDRRIVMRVRSTEYSYYRGLAFTDYDGAFWSLPEEEPRTLTTTTPPLFVPLEAPGDRQVVHIYHVERALPNVVFAPFQPYQLYFPSEEVFMDEALGLRAPFALEEGMVYSVIGLSRRPDSHQDLKRMPPVEKFKRLRYHPATQLPEDVPERVRRLAHSLTDQYESPYEKAMAITLHLKNHYTYRLDVPPYPEGTEVADYFLFEQKEGYCEQFATAMVVLCRAVGIPARYVTGYLPGTYNPLTGYYEVRGHDAHAWVEVFIPAWGWTSFDPAAGAPAAPGLHESPGNRWLLAALFDYLKDKIPPEQRQAAGRMAAALRERWEGALAALERSGVPRAAGVALAVLVAVQVPLWTGWFLLRRARRTGRWNPLARILDRAVAGLAALVPERPRTPADHVRAAYRQMLRLLEPLGFRRPDSMTPREYAGQVAADRDWPEVEEITGLFERVRYAEAEVGAEEERATLEALGRLQDRARLRREEDPRGEGTTEITESPSE